MDKLTAIKVFLTVAETGSFTATAERLEISKPMISRYVALMEEWLNARPEFYRPKTCRLPFFTSGNA